MRNLGNVIEQVLAVIPDDFQEKKKIIEHTDSLMKGVRYTAPEQMPNVWGAFGNILGAYLGEPQGPEDWRLKVQAIMSGN